MVYRAGTPASEAFDPVLRGAWGELAVIMRRHLPGLKAPASLVPDLEASAIWALGTAVRRWPKYGPGSVMAAKSEAFDRAASGWLWLHALASRYDLQRLRGDDELRHAWVLASQGCQTFTREDMPLFRAAFRDEFG